MMADENVYVYVSVCVCLCVSVSYRGQLLFSGTFIYKTEYLFC